MKDRLVARLLWIALVAFPALAHPQDSNRPREFAEFRGTWLLDEARTDDLRQALNSAGRTIVYDQMGFPVARTLVIATTPTEISVTKDSGLPEVYRFDGTETQTRDPRTGARLNPRYSFTLVAESLALTSKTTGDRRAGGDVPTTIITDAYSLAEWDVLSVVRQLSILVEPPGYLMTLARLRNFKHTLNYRRQQVPAP